MEKHERLALEVRKYVDSIWPDLTAQEKASRMFEKKFWGGSFRLTTLLLAFPEVSDGEIIATYFTSQKGSDP